MNSKTTFITRLKPLAFATVLAFSGGASATTFTVTNTANSGVGSLSDALTQAANCAGAPHTVVFAIPAPPFIISPGGTLNIGGCAGTLIDGYTQPGSAANGVLDPAGGSSATILIQINGTGITGGGMLTGSGTNQTIRGLNLRNYLQPGNTITLSGTGGVIAGNFIGTDVSGNSCTGAGMSNGISLPAGGSVGTGAAADRNVIGCASGNAVVFPQGTATVRGNLIGKGAAGNPIPNAGSAVVIGPCLSCFAGNAVGSTLLGQGNVLAYSSTGVGSFGNINSAVVGNDIFQNAIGIDFSGGAANTGAATPPAVGATGVTYSSGSTTISGTLGTSANQTGINVDFFQNLGGGLDQGEEYVGTAVGFSTPAGGPPGNFSATIPQIVRNPTVTYTVGGATSRFSAPHPTPESAATPPAFPATTVGQASAVQPFTIGNPSSAPLVVDFVNSNSAEFKDTTTPAGNAYCGAGRDAVGGPLAAQATIAAGNTCTINMIFQPSAVGPRSGNFQVNSNAPQNPQAFVLTGTGLAAAAPALSISPAAVGFGTVPIGNTAGPQPVTLTNTGTAPLNFSGAFTVTGDYAQTTACPPQLQPSPAPNSSCTVNVTFTPTVTGPRPGVLTITSDAPGSPHTVNLSGTGSAAAAPVVNIAPTSLTFPAQTVGTTSAAQSATLTNTGTATLNISSISSTGDFAFTTACGASLPPAPGPGNSCPINVTFTPIFTGTRTGAITIADNASGSPHVLSLTGTGTVTPVATITVTPPALTFPATQVGTTSAPQPVTVSNTGANPLTIIDVQMVGSEFTVTFNSCAAATLPMGGSCQIDVVFTPAGAGARGATLRIISNASSSPTLVNVTGTGTAAPTGTLAADPPSLTFTDRVGGTSSPPQQVAITNTGVAPVTVSSVSVSGDFSQTNDCTVIAVGGGCTVSIVFSPTGVGSRDGALTIVSDASNPAFSVSLLGNGVITNLPVLQLSATTLGFGNRVMGVGSSTQVVTARNVGGANLVITRVYTQGDFRTTSDCTTGQIPPGGTCRIDVGLYASVPGPRGGKLFVESNAGTVPKTVDLSGLGCRFFTIPGSRISTLACF